MMMGWMSILVVFLASVLHLHCQAATPDTCEIEGVVYEDGEQIPTDDNCLSCACAPHLPSKVSCVSVMCAFPMCVDAEYDEQGCCLMCPNGKNCLYDGAILPADETVEYREGGCEVTCSCPVSLREYMENGQDTDAVCYFRCDLTWENGEDELI